MDILDAIIWAKGPLLYVLRDEPIVLLEGNKPLDQNAYYVASVGLADELGELIKPEIKKNAEIDFFAGTI